MLNSTRQIQMKEFIEKQKNVTVQQLIEHFRVSDMTVRRDLVQLEKLGTFKRVHGGVVYTEDLEEDILLSIREDSHKPEKERIAEKAVSLVLEGQSVLLDAGSTTLEIARKLLAQKNITVITNAINIASLLSQNVNLQVIMTGGDVRHSTQSLVGPTTVQFLRQLQVDHAFIGCSGLSQQRGLMNSNMVEGEVKRTMMTVTRHVYVVADHTKFEQTAFNRFAGWEHVDAVISTTQVKEEYQREFQEKESPKLILV
ncbi:DeoR/GlpR transcriptional regulator [Brevibacillus nitrificans]|uniref:DeoR/GlpR transcriptional regulator n=1 Tax=Brevibacillus nitrificans TaxID=651560 RepID=A0A3M8DLY8_9BACL|nr:DeoR/GlpR family DNA-binding transcription regulator [Brevibacillus nitrificans]RNB88649.1 DeoR/GlpR transcriptional regulator [Brevibacillus nitrificans]